MYQRTSDSKIILIGDSSVGKTSIITQYNYHIFEPDSQPTVGASFVSKVIETPHGRVQLHIWDTAGQERYRSLIPMYSRAAIAAILVIDVTNIASYNSKDIWVKVVGENCEKNCKIYIVANKIDLMTDFDTITNPTAEANSQFIPLGELQKWAEEHNYPFFRTSAKDYQSVELLFNVVAEDIIISEMDKNTVTMKASSQNQNGETNCC